MSKPTPGPWRYAECQMGTPFVDTESVGDLFAAALPLDEERANAHLIAAAPDLLAACERALILMSPAACGGRVANVDSLIAEIGKAVDKAKGNIP